MEEKRLLLVLPLRAYRHDGAVYIDGQARNGLRLWLDNFPSLTLACRSVEDEPPAGFLAIDDPRVQFVALPEAFTPLRFARALPASWTKLASVIDQSGYLHFAIGGLIGDWASVAALIAHRKNRRFAVWTDRVESSVALFQSKARTPIKRTYYASLAALMKRFERHIIGLADLGLFHGMDCFNHYAPYCRNPHLVHNVHLSRGDAVTPEEIDEHIHRGARIKIAYVGRAHRDKGIYDWIEALRLATAAGIDFEATWFGSGPELEAARAEVIAQSTSNISFVGDVDHSTLIKQLKTFDLMLFCHKTEESPRCLIEALICGLPIVGYESHYARDLIKLHGGGILTPRNHPDLISRSLREFLNRRRELSIAAANDGWHFDADALFKHRSDLMKAAM